MNPKIYLVASSPFEQNNLVKRLVNLTFKGDKYSI